jgi:hypothetical protein
VELPLFSVSALEDGLGWTAQGDKEFAWQKGKLGEEYSERLPILPARVRAT